MARKVRLGIMGCGWPGGMHAEAIQEIPGAEIAAVSDPDADRRSAFVARFGEVAEFDDARRMLRGAELDAVVNALPTGMHYRTSRAALEAGLHVMCEKPPTTKAAEMMELARLAKRKRLVYSFCRQPRYSPLSLEARRLVETGAIGDVYLAESNYIRCRGIPFGAGGWFVNKKKGGGVLLDLGIHAIDDAWFIMGCPRPVEVMAGLYCAFSDLAPEGVEYTAEDAAVGQIRFADGATLRFMTTFALNDGGPDVSQARGVVNQGRGETRLYGPKGGIDVGAGKLLLGREKGVLVKPLKPKSKLGTFTAQDKTFIQAIRTGGEPGNTAGQAVMLMQMLEALRKSGDSGRAVRIPRGRSS